VLAQRVSAETCLSNGVPAAHTYCYSVNRNGDQKVKAGYGCPKTGEIIEEHLSTLPPTEAEAMLNDIHKLAVNPSRPAASRSRPI
jgi:hypothetical protein